MVFIKSSRDGIMIIKALKNTLADSATKKISIGVTGFSRAGKTVFITSLAHALMTAKNWQKEKGAGPLAQFSVYEKGAFKSARIREDIDSHLPQFPYRKMRESLLGVNTHWPEATTGISRLFIEIDSEQSSGVSSWLANNAGMSDLGLGKVIIELVDFPGEWLIDLPMLDLNYADWSEKSLLLARSVARHKFCNHFFTKLSAVDAELETGQVSSDLAEAWTLYLQQCAETGLTLNQPGRHLRPDAFKGSPILCFAPMDKGLEKTVLYKLMQKRYEEYKKKVITPFYKENFAKIDRQIFLVDVLSALEKGEAVFSEMTNALQDVLKQFNYSKGGVLSKLGFAKTTHVLFAATKSDHVIRGDRKNLEEMLRKMLYLADDLNNVHGKVAKYQVMSLSSVKATSDFMTTQAPRREILKGRPDGEAESALYDPGGLPLDMPPYWEDVNFVFYRFAPQAMPDALHQGFPAINLGKALEFLIGDDVL